MKLSEIYREGEEEYVDDDSAAALESLPESAWPIIVKAGKAMAGGGDSPGIDFTVATTRETVENFLSASKSWNECGAEKQISDEPIIITFEGVQALKGQRRVSLAIIDLGDVRAVLTA